MDYKEFLFPVGGLIAFYLVSRLFTWRKSYLVKYGTPVIAKVTKVIETNVTTSSGNNYYASRQLDIYLDIENAEPARQINIVKFFFPGTYPQVGDRLRVLIDPKDKYNLMISPDQDGIQ